MTALYLPRAPELQLPWSSSHREDARFRQLALIAVALAIVLSVVVHLVPLPPLTPPKLLEQSQLAHVIIDRALLPQPAPQPVVAPKPKPKPIVASQPVTRAVPVQHKPQPVPRVVAKMPRATHRGGGHNREAPVEMMQQARDVAAKSGVLAFKDELAEMRESVDVSHVTRSNLTRGVGTAEKTERHLIAGQANRSSGGINTAALSRDTGGIALSGRETTAIVGPPGVYGHGTAGGGVGRGRGDGVGNGHSRKGDLVAADGSSGGRSDEAIRRIMDRNKGAIFAIYNRALRENPDLKGRFVFEMVIAPSGQVTAVKLVSSELGDRQLIARILARIQMISFGREDVQRTRVNYSLDFLPS